MNGAWYFATREGDEGPYRSEDQVRSEIRRFIYEKAELAHFQKAREQERAELVIEDVDSLPNVRLMATADHPRLHPTQPVLSKRKVHL